MQGRCCIAPRFIIPQEAWEKFSKNPPSREEMEGLTNEALLAAAAAFNKLTPSAAGEALAKAKAEYKQLMGKIEGFDSVILTCTLPGFERAGSFLVFWLPPKLGKKIVNTLLTDPKSTTFRGCLENQENLCVYTNAAYLLHWYITLSPSA